MVACYLRYNGGPDTPGGLPRFFVVSADAKTYFSVGFEPSAWCGEAEARRSQRVGGWQNYLAMVDALAVDGVGWPAEGKVPFKEVGFQGFCGVVWRWAIGYFGRLSN